MTSISIRPTSSPSTTRANVRLWIAQGILAAVFLFAGGMKLVSPTDVLAAQSHLPGAFMKFIGTCETLGAFGLILPGLFRIQPRLTWFAASGLMIIMIGAVVTTIVQGMGAMAVIPGLVGVLAAYVVRGRSR